MKKIIFIIFCFISFQSFGQEYWKEVKDKDIARLEKTKRNSFPGKYKLFSLDFQLFKQKLDQAPLDNCGYVSNTIIQFPDFDGEIKNYRVYEAPILDKELSDKYDGINSYIAESIDTSKIKLRFSVTLFGLHVMSTFHKDGTLFIDTYTKDLSNYILYNKKDIVSSNKFVCKSESNNNSNHFNKNNLGVLASDGLFRQYRTTITTTALFSQSHIVLAGVENGTLAQKINAVLSGVTVTMTRVNGIFERDFSVRMNLVANNDLLFFIGSDTFNLDNILDENIEVTNSIIGNSNYDVGHIFTSGGGGVAAYACICQPEKAAGTTGTDNPVGDPFDVDYVAHEIGHQFGASHTFNNSCGDNISTDHSVEPGSGSTIMAYAGICSPNVQSHSDAYFSVTSILEVNETITDENSCAQTTPNLNAAPVIAPLTNYIIPHGTAFVLRGQATDTNNDNLTYCWEQNNVEVSVQPPSPTSVQGPNFRSLMPSPQPYRYFPVFSQVLAGNLTPTWEVVPNVSRMMNFALTVRDNRIPNGGQTTTSTNFVSTASVGPFRVTYPNQTNLELLPGSTQNITWDVSGTTSNGINTSLVNILISIDGGSTFTNAVSNTPNDGNQSIVLPSSPAPFCRILIEAVNNVFYAVSPSFSIGYTITTQCNTYTDNSSIPIISDENNGYTTRTFTVPNQGIVSDVNVFNTLTHEYFGDVVTDLSGPLDPLNFIRLLNGNCGDLNGNLNLKFTDEGANINCQSSSALQVVRPAGQLSIFNNQEGQGTWTFRVYDHVTPDDGTLSSWSVEVCQQIPMLSINNYSLNGLSIFPNPNNGEFSVTFNSSNNLPIEINVYDLRGRSVFNQKYPNENYFEKTIQLQNVQNGIYLVQVQNGNLLETKKVVLVK